MSNRQLTEDKNEDIRAYYEEFAGSYDQKHGVSLYGQSYNFRQYYEPFLVESLPLDGRALELGCGTGYYTQWLCKRGLNVTALDISPKMVERAQSRAPHANCLVGDCQNPATVLSIEGKFDQFDIVVGINTFSYYPEKQRALLNYNKLLGLGKKFVVIDMNGASLLYNIMARMNKNEMRHWLPEIKESSNENLRKILGTAGFEIERMEQFAFVPNGVSPFPARCLIPIDTVLSKLALFKRLAMRIAYVAVKVEEKN